MNSIMHERIANAAVALLPEKTYNNHIFQFQFYLYNLKSSLSQP